MPWFMLRRRGHEVIFATQSGDMAVPDPASATSPILSLPFLGVEAPPALVGDMFAGMYGTELID